MPKRNDQKKKAQQPGMIPGIAPPDGSSLSMFLDAYRKERELNDKGQIASMIFASRLARTAGLPFDTEANLVTDGKGQVKGLGKTAVQSILKEYGIATILAKEGGRTSRGSLGNIRDYLERLNKLHSQIGVDLSQVEAWWVGQAKRFFNAKPFMLRFEHGKALRAVVRDLFAQAKKRQAESKGTMFVGAMLQHLVGAKLGLAMPNEVIKYHGFSVADEVSGRSGDFEIGSASIHVTTAPGEAVMRVCRANLDAGRHPIVVTVYEMLPAADTFAAQIGIQDKIDVLDAEQFIVTNLHELGAFAGDKRKITIDALIDKYNEIVSEHETDPSLCISRS